MPTITAYTSKEEFDKAVAISDALDTFCQQVNFLDTVVNNKALDLVVDFCDVNGNIQDSIKIFSPILKDGMGEREIFIEVGGKVVETITQSAFETGGATAGRLIGSAIITAGSVGTAGVGTIPAWIMGTATGGAFYLGAKYVGIPVSEFAGEYSKEYLGELYDKYLVEQKALSITSNQPDSQSQQTPPENSVVFLDASKNESVTYTIDENKNLQPTQKTTYSDNGSITGVVSLQSGQTISHIASNTKFSTIDLLKYNDLSLEQAKNLPVGFVVKVPSEINLIDGGYGTIKEYKGVDGSSRYEVPVQDGSVKVLILDKNGNLTRDELSSSSSDNVEIVKNSNNEIDINKLEQYAYDGKVKDVPSETNQQQINAEYNLQKAYNSIKEFNSGKQDYNQVFNDISKSPNVVKEFASTLKEKGNDDLLEYFNDNGTFKTNVPDVVKQKILLETQEDKQLSTQLGSSIGGSIGSVIIANNNFSNIEKIAVSTATITIGQNAGEYVYWNKTTNGTEAFDDVNSDFTNNLQGAITSFAVSAYFAKNNTFSKNKNLNLKLLNQFSQKTHKIIYNIISEINSVNNPNYSTVKNLLVG